MDYYDNTQEDSTTNEKSLIHEERLLALLTLVDKFKKGDPSIQKEIYDLYLKNTPLIRRPRKRIGNHV